MSISPAFLEATLNSAFAAAAGVTLALIAEKVRASKKPKSTQTHEKKVSELLEKLAEASRDIDVATSEMAEDINTRKEAIDALKAQHEALASEEEALRKKVETLKDVPIEVANYFRDLQRTDFRNMERRGTVRDICFLIVGIVLTSVIGLALQ